jgi:hypothetical protein
MKNLASAAELGTEQRDSSLAIGMTLISRRLISHER